MSMNKNIIPTPIVEASTVSSNASLPNCAPTDVEYTSSNLTGSEPEFNKSAICFASLTPCSPLNPPEISTFSELIGWLTVAAEIYFGSLPSCSF